MYFGKPPPPVSLKLSGTFGRTACCDHAMRVRFSQGVPRRPDTLESGVIEVNMPDIVVALVTFHEVTSPRNRVKRNMSVKLVTEDVSHRLTS